MSKYDALATLGVGLMQFGSQYSDRQLRREQLANEKARQDALLKLEQRKADLSEKQFAWQQTQGEIENTLKLKELGVQQSRVEATNRQTAATEMSTAAKLADSGIGLNDDGNFVDLETGEKVTYASRFMMKHGYSVDAADAIKGSSSKPSDRSIEVRDIVAGSKQDAIDTIVPTLSPEQQTKIRESDDPYKTLSSMTDEEGHRLAPTETQLRRDAQEEINKQRGTSHTYEMTHEERENAIRRNMELFLKNRGIEQSLEDLTMRDFSLLRQEVIKLMDEGEIDFSASDDGTDTDTDGGGIGGDITRRFRSYQGAQSQ